MLVLAAMVILAGCASAAGKQSSDPGKLRARTLGSAIAKPALTLTDTNGRPYDLRARTDGSLTLLYFGYTHCPDVCPATMANIAIAEKQLAVVRAKTSVVFVSTDPARDTPSVLKKWLAHFPGGNFVGLTGSERAIYQAAASVGVPLDPPQKQRDGSYSVNHGSQVLAFSPLDAKAHAVFTAETTSDDYAHDLPLLLDGKTS